MDKIRYPIELNPRMSDFAKRSSGISEGWFPLTVELYDKLVAMYPDFVITQVKEKFGTLRFYIEHYPQESHLQKVVHKLIDTAMVESSKVCEVCGEPGRIESIQQFVVATRCKNHLTEGTEYWD